MKKTYDFLRKYPFSLASVIAILVVSLINIPDTPLNGIHLIDKWTHIALYFVLGLIIAHEYFHGSNHTDTKGMFLRVWLLPVIYGGAMEIMQLLFTNGRRNGEILDFVADIVGSSLALIIGTLLAKYLSKEDKGAGASAYCRNAHRQ